MKHRGRVLVDEIVWEQPGYWLDDLREHRNKNVVVTIKTDRRERSHRQNSYLWAVCYKMIGDQLGYDPEDIHELMKRKFLAPKSLLVKGEAFDIPESTRRLNTLEFTQYIEAIRRWAAQYLGINIPDPSPDIVKNPPEEPRPGNVSLTSDGRRLTPDRSPAEDNTASGDIL